MDRLNSCLGRQYQHGFHSNNGKNLCQRHTSVRNHAYCSCRFVWQPI